MAALSGGAPRLLAQTPEPVATADSMILLWMAGGMAQTETWDPKKYTAYESGMESKRVLSTFPSIPTVVDNIRLSQGLEEMAKVMDRGTLIRSHRVGDLGFILHSRHQYHWHTGYEPPQSIAVPHMGAWIAKLLGPRKLPSSLPGRIWRSAPKAIRSNHSTRRVFSARIPGRS